MEFKDKISCGRLRWNKKLCEVMDLGGLLVFGSKPKRGKCERNRFASNEKKAGFFGYFAWKRSIKNLRRI